MIDHVSLAVRNLPASAAFFEQVLQPLGMTRLVDRQTSVGFGKTYPEIWLNARPSGAPQSPDTGHHVCLRARTESAVIAFHAAALRHGGASAGEPGPRQAALTPYFAAFVFDLDGNKIEAASFPKPA